jgi:two-component system, LuxR family, response regulator FixJ
MELKLGRIYVVDDDADIRESITCVLDSVGYETKAYCNAEEFLADGVHHDPHCLIVDLLLPGMTGLKLCREVLSSSIACGFIVITGNGDIPTAVEAMRLGACDFLEKPFDRQRLLECVNEVFKSIRSQVAGRQEEREALARLAKLTARELDIFRKVAAGLPTKAIAADCEISTRTVDVHRSRILQKLQIESSVQLAQFIVVLDRCPGGRAGWASA